MNKENNFYSHFGLIHFINGIHPQVKITKYEKISEQEKKNMYFKK